jgi:tRNA(Ile)-lysidine synthase
LLDMRHAATVAFCQSRGVTPRDDETNRDPRFTRNRVRHELLPLLETYQANVIPILARNAAAVAADLDYLMAATETAWEECAIDSDVGVIALDRAALRAQPLALRRRVLQMAAHVANQDDPEAQVTFDSIQRLDRVALDALPDRRVVQLANGTEAVVAGNVVTVSLPSDK